MSKPTVGDILELKPEARPRIYAYSIDDNAHNGLLKIGQTTRDVKQRVAEQLKTAAIKNYTIELDEPAERADGTIFTDHEVRAALVRKKFETATLPATTVIPSTSIWGDRSAMIRATASSEAVSVSISSRRLRRANAAMLPQPNAFSTKR